MHHARWMAKVIYSLKILLFRENFPLTEDEKDGLRIVCIFIVTFYIKNWFTCASRFLSPWNDFQLIKQLIEFQTINETTATAALNKITNHLWYLSEELIGLSFFDDRISLDMKKK